MRIFDDLCMRLTQQTPPKQKTNTPCGSTERRRRARIPAMRWCFCVCGTAATRARGRWPDEEPSPINPQGDLRWYGVQLLSAAPFEKSCAAARLLFFSLLSSSPWPPAQIAHAEDHPLIRALWWFWNINKAPGPVPKASPFRQRRSNE